MESRHPRVCLCEPWRSAWPSLYVDECECVSEFVVSVDVCGSLYAPVNKPWRRRWRGLLMPGSDWGCGRANLLGASSRVKVCAVLRSSGGSEGVFGRILRVCVCVGGGV